MSIYEIRARRWPIVLPSLFLLPFVIPFFLLTAASLIGPAPLASLATSLVCSAAFGSWWLSLTLSAFRPPRLIFGNLGFTYEGNFWKKGWLWTQLQSVNDVRNGVMFEIREENSNRTKKIFIGPGWAGGSARIICLAKERGWESAQTTSSVS